MAHAGGRPTKYIKSYCSRVDEYLKTTGREATEMPTICGFAIFLGVTTKTVENWGNRHEEFLRSLEKILTYQQKQLINDGIYGGKEVNSTIVKLLLMNNHGMRERNDLTSDNKQMFPKPIIDD